MKQRITILNLLVFFILFTTIDINAIVKPNNTDKAKLPHYLELKFEDLIHLERSDLEVKLGRKFSIREKIALKLTKRKLQKNSELNSTQDNESAKTNGFAIAGLICGILGLLVAGIILGILALIFGGVALSKIKNNPETTKGRGLAIAAIVLGIISIVGAIVFIAMM